MATAVERYEELENSYLPDGLDGEAVIHVYIAAIDFQLRFVTMCAAAKIRELDPDHVRLHRSPGFGTFLAYLSAALGFLRGTAQASADPVDELIEAVLAEIDQISGKDPQFGTLKKLRDHLFHGNPLPTGDARQATTERVRRTMQNLSSLIRGYLAGAELRTVADESGMHQLELRWPRRHLGTWPFICLDEAGRMCVLTSFTGTAPAYLRADHSEVRVETCGDDLMIALNRSLRAQNEDRTFRGFVDDLRADLDGFRDLDHALHPYDKDAEVTVYWHQALSTGAEPRTDRFRIGDSDQRLWRDDQTSTWLPYRDFLRRLANWQVVASRVRQHLVAVEHELVAGERKALGWTRTTDDLVTPRVKVTSMQDAETDGSVEYMDFTGLQDEIDERLRMRSTQTRVYFVRGEAGIGKTRALVTAALDRARAIESEDESIASDRRLPLFYFVRSTGETSGSLDNAIAAASAATRNLELETVKTLCRNGLIALFIDGFDELLGGVGYENALGSLKPWIDAMGGRGVIVVSARSSYYLNQYRTSLVREQRRQQVLVQHRVASLQPWRETDLDGFLRSHGIDPVTLDDLESEDRRLLGLPFFARVYVEAVTAGRAGAATLPDIVLEQYLQRESMKLLMGGGQDKPLLSPAELRGTFEAIAALMAEQGARAVELKDLELAVQAALSEDDLQVRPGLLQRLSVLCGLAVDEGASAKRLFTFQHELFYDLFLADALLSELRRDNLDTVVAMLTKTQLRVATAARVVRSEARAVEELLRLNSTRADDLPAGRQEAYRANLGSLWALIARHAKTLCDIELEGLTFAELDLTGTEVANVTFRGCTFGRLELPAERAKNLQFERGTIDALWLPPESQHLPGIERFEGTEVSQLIALGSLFERPQEIQRTLQKLGLPVPAVPEDGHNEEFADAVEALLNNFRQRPDSVVVYQRDLMPADDNSRWQLAFGSEVWTTFIKFLRDSQSAKLVPMSAGGAAVQRVRVQFIEQLYHRDIDDNPPVADFWDRVASCGVKPS
ncbi:hypothetical protein [Amycolatopsis sp. NPDC050768]|uniref:hypothetical protein n=1 Tax=Amycolatopsis sp. NPDC050768 TaxID=3154839 RepID=UPI0033E73E81